MSKFRILSIFLAVGLLVGALGVGPVLAGQIDVTGLDTRDASYAPAQVDVDAGEVEWTSDDGEDVKYANDSQKAVFYINDDDIETTSDKHIATWRGAVVRTNGVTEGFNVHNGEVAGSPAASYLDTTGPADEDGPGGFATSTFVGASGNTPIHTVTELIAVEDSATTTLTEQALITAKQDLVKVLGGTLPTFNFVQITFKHHNVDAPEDRARVVSSSDPQGELVTINEVGSVGGTDMSADSDVYRGSVQLSKDPAKQGPGEEEPAVWVQDGDTLTVHYLDEDGDVVDSDSITVDAAAPEISGVTPADGTHTSTENPTLQFDALDTGSGYDAKDPSKHFDVYVGVALYPKGHDKEGKVMTDMDDNPVLLTGEKTGVRLGADNDFSLSPVPVTDGYRVIFTSSESWLDDDVFGDADQSGTLNIALVAEDIALNKTVSLITVTIDTGEPITESAATGAGWDSGKEEETSGVANGVKLVMSEPIDPDSVDATDFEIDSQAAATAEVGTGVFHSHIIYLTAQSDFDSDARPDVEIVAKVTDLSGNSVDISSDSTTNEEKNALDRLKPTATVSRDNALLAAKDDEVTVTIESDEKLKSGGAMVSIIGPNSGTAADLFKAASADEPQVHSLTHSIGAEEATGKYGISVKITDIQTNYSTNLTKVTNEEAEVKVVEGKHTITVANGPIGDANVDGELNGMDVSVVVLDKDGAEVATSTEAAAQVVADGIDASARTIVIAGISGGVNAKVTYHHPSADNTFEVDQLGPEVSFSVVDDDELTNSSPFIKVSFNDDEYPGDSYTDVSLTAATLTMGDDEMDIAGDFAAEANGHNYLWAGVTLALGEYTLDVTGEDTAGNETDGSLTFTIIERPATQVALTPGVNLISLPGTPATTSVEGVFGGSDVTSVLTYDPSTPTKWLAAERAPDGSWVGNLTDVSASLGYWVTTSSFDALSVDIVSFSAGGATLPPTHNLVPGWNLVAVTTLDEVEKTADADPVDANTYLGNNWLRAITYDAQLGRFVTAGPDDLDDDGNPPTLTVGKGYFVWMTKPHTVVP